MVRMRMRVAMGVMVEDYGEMLVTSRVVFQSIVMCSKMRRRERMSRQGVRARGGETHKFASGLPTDTGYI